MINIVTFPHAIAQIQNQIDFLTDSLRDSGVIYQVSNSISTQHLNILEEGFYPFFASEIAVFCKNHKTKIAVILTEHLEHKKNSMLVNERKLGVRNTYLRDALIRCESLFSLLPHIRFFLVLGHLPLKEKLKKIFKTIPIVEAPYLPVKALSVIQAEADIQKIDFCYQGSLTPHRKRVLKTIKNIPASVSASFDNDAHQRLLTLKSARFALQIPQYKEWRYISPMRALYCLQNGIPMINISDHVTHDFDLIFPRVGTKKLTEELEEYLTLSPEKCYLDTVDRYNAFVERQAKSKLPAMLKLWNDLDRSNSFPSNYFKQNQQQ
ncbi:MAG: hypothetical protein ACD_42C00440G0005 [uncultured bacterium]|nr:MAG: hypothetical protein ACD_42C00440G0005 [uncultured bacterium]OGT34300.1 MAG: hypothetical protein A3C44_07510 [Gammaproteobacteria bacterium RIFCSPHIGHO2_02_FULL_39_13]OGT48950.1 MAG: hypothetical protein A3E53_01490 [Gammaproteobacteria bacterium RIFCSPHIGHO2_12_FULL_39_24]